MFNSSLTFVLLLGGLSLLTACGGGGGTTQPTSPPPPVDNGNTPTTTSYRLDTVETFNVIDLEAEIMELSQEQYFEYNSQGNLTSRSQVVFTENYPQGREALFIEYFYDTANAQQTDFVTMDTYNAWWDGGTGELTQSYTWDETWQDGVLAGNTEEIQYFDSLGNITNTQFNSLERFYDLSGNNNWIEIDTGDDGTIDVTEERTWSSGKLSTVSVINVVSGPTQTQEFTYADGQRETYTIYNEQSDILNVYVYDFSTPTETQVLQATLENASFADPETDTVYTLHVLHYVPTACGQYIATMDEVIIEPLQRCITVQD